MTPAVPSISYRFGPFLLLPSERQLLASGASLRVGPHAFDLLVVLVERGGHLVTKDELLERVWPKVIIEENTLQAHMSALRKVLGSDAIATVSGRGYRFALPVRAQAPASPPAAAAEAPHNLPHDLTSFVGRETELAELVELQRESRLLTLTGSGGCGKTRLALRLARRLCLDRAAGAWLVELAPVTDAELLPKTVATVLGLQEAADRPLTDAIVEFVGQRDMLIVLDNAEHLLEASARFVDALLRRCGGLAVVVTSRERLRIAGELTYRVPSLSLPGAEANADPVSVAACESARLFIDRARLHSPHFRVTPENAGALASICRRLDGIALAIELAAPRVRSMSLTDLGQRLEERFVLLVEGSRAALPRHQTLRSLIDWSFEPLDEAEKAMLCSVSVFSGGWTLDAAQAVYRGGAGRIDDVLGTLTSLADKNLVLAEAGAGPTRYGLLETVRQYARERLHERGEASQAQRAHLAHCLALAEKANAELSGPDQVSVLDRLEVEHGNLRAALSFGASPDGDARRAMLLAHAVSRFWSARGHMIEGRRWFTELLALPSDPGAFEARGKCLNAATYLALALGHLPWAQRLSQESVDVHRQLGQPRGIAMSLGVRGSVLSSLGDYPQARACLEEGLAILRSLGATLDSPLNNLALLLQRMGDLESARGFHEEVLSIRRANGDVIGTGGSLMNLADVALNAGAPGQAHLLYEQAAGLFQKAGNLRLLARVWTALGIVMCDEGDPQGALLVLRKGLASSLELDDRPNVCDTLHGLGNAFATRDPETAATLWGADERQRESHASMVLTSLEQARDDAVLALARAALGDDAAFDRAWREGRAMSFDEAAAFAMRL